MKKDIGNSEFRSLVFQLVKLIPRGRATSYGAIAKAIGYPALSRLVGKVMGGASDIEEDNIPAHRVVNSQGILSGRFAFKTPSTMQEKLEEEGISIERNKIKDWNIVFWDPYEEL